jgi:hypothetical protein
MNGPVLGQMIILCDCILCLLYILDLITIGGMYDLPYCFQNKTKYIVELLL